MGPVGFSSGASLWKLMAGVFLVSFLKEAQKGFPKTRRTKWRAGAASTTSRLSRVGNRNVLPSRVIEATWNQELQITTHGGNLPVPTCND